MRMKTLSTAFAAVLAAVLQAAVPIVWKSDVAKPETERREAFHGTTLELEATLVADGRPLAVTNGEAWVYWQTNGMGVAFWSADAAVSGNVVRATFTPEMDPGAAVVNGFLGTPREQYAAFQLRFRPSPGAEPNVLLPPVVTLDFARVTVTNAPWATPSITNGLVTASITNGLVTASVTNGLVSLDSLAPRVSAIITNEVDEYVMEMEGDNWVVEQTTARFVVSDVVWTPRGDGQYTVSFRANGESKSIDYPDSVTYFVVCTDRGCYVYFPGLDYGLTVAEMMPELSMPNQWALTMGTTGGYDGGADSFVHRVSNALGLVTVDDLAGVRAEIGSAASLATNAADYAVATADTTYRRVIGITNLNQSVQYVSVTDDAPTTLTIDLPSGAATADWILYVASVTNVSLSLPSATWYMADEAYTNDVAPATPTAFFFSQMADGLYLLSRQELKPITIVR